MDEKVRHEVLELDMEAKKDIGIFILSFTLILTQHIFGKNIVEQILRFQFLPCTRKLHLSKHNVTGDLLF